MRGMLCFVLMCCAAFVFGQSGAEKRQAAELARSAEVAMGEGNMKLAAEQFRKARKMDAGNSDYLLGEAEARFFMGDSKETIRLTQELAKGMKGKEAAVVKSIRLYGGSLAFQGKFAAGQQAIEKGLEQYPKAGELYAELGMLHLESGRKERAVEIWEDGMRNAPEFAGNYLAAGKILGARGDLAWAIIYLEQYLNLQRKGMHVKEVSGLLLDLYRRAWHCSPDGSCQLVFFQELRRDVSDTEGEFAPSPDLHRQMGVAYGSDLDLEGEMGIQTVLSMLLEGAEVMKTLGTQADGYFEWLEFVASEGMLEGYVFWLLQDGAPLEYGTWHSMEADTFEEFERWFARNRMLHTLKDPAIRPKNHKQ